MRVMSDEATESNVKNLTTAKGSSRDTIGKKPENNGAMSSFDRFENVKLSTASTLPCDCIDHFLLALSSLFSF
jgi:hypothetical protein